MDKRSYTYVIVGAGLSGITSVEGIRELDRHGSILVLGAEADPPYDRPPLSKQLWTGAQTVGDIRLHPREFYEQNNVDLRLGSRAVQLDVGEHTLRDNLGNTYRYERLLLATGGTPRRLDIPGGDLEGINYFRTLRDYRQAREAAADSESALVIGGGFIGAEMAAALCMNNLAVTMIFPSPWIASRVLPEQLGRAMNERFRAKGVELITNDVPTAIERDAEGYLARTRAGRTLRGDMVIAGIGITPNTDLAQAAGLVTDDGVLVNEYLHTSGPDVYAAGDVAYFPECNRSRRVEHWDNARTQGKSAGRNMAGAQEPFTYIPMFFSDLFEFGYEAVGDIDSRYETFADWQEENIRGVVYYLRDGRLQGMLMCNLFGKADAARELIEQSGRIVDEELQGAIR